MSGSMSTAINDGRNQQGDLAVSDSLLPFEFSLDPSDPLHFLMTGAGGADELSVDSFEDTSSSSHGSPPEWPTFWNQSLSSSPQALLKKVDRFDDPSRIQWPEGFPQLTFDGTQMELDGIHSGPAIAGGNQGSMQFDPALFAQAALSLGFDLDQVNSLPNCGHDLSTSLLYPYDYPSGFLSKGDRLDVGNHASQRRLSVTSSSSSGGSMSPIGDCAGSAEQQSSIPPSQSTSTDGFSDLVQRALQSTGVTSAIQNLNPSGSSNVAASQSSTPSGKLPIPRLARPLQQGAAVAKSGITDANTASSSPSSSPPPSDHQQVSTSNPRPKTSHTTIERRYRTNLNARIQSLRAAVPALRVLEQKDGNKVGNLNLKAGIRRTDESKSGENEEVDIVDSRGFVDGVKVARKGSKANVLGKAVEYIRVLKKRERRLKREQDGLKSLISGLVGGPALLREWESEWVQRYGGPEQDEVEGEAEEDDEDEDEEDADGEDIDAASGKKRKRPKVETGGANSSMKRGAAGDPSGLGELAPKRGRGRPRKVAPAPPAPANFSLAGLTAPLPAGVPPSTQPTAVYGQQIPQIQVTGEQDGHSRQYAQPVQYMLAAFALFSFFRSPAGSPSTFHYGAPHTHFGAVLSPNSPLSGASQSQDWHTTVPPLIEWREIIQFSHMAVAVLLLLTVVGTWVPALWKIRVHQLVPSALKPLLVSTPRTPVASVRATTSSHEDEDGGAAATAGVELKHALGLRGQKGLDSPLQHEMIALRSALHVKDGILGVFMAVLPLTNGASGSTGCQDSLERRTEEQRAWIRFGELVALDGHATWTTRLQTYICMSKYLPYFTPSAVDLSTLALVVHPFWPSKGTSLWNLARKRANDKNVHGSQICKPFERLVLEELSVEVAVARIANSSSLDIYGTRSISELVEHSGHGPLGLLARQIVRDSIRKHAEHAFLRTVLGDCQDDADAQQDAEMRRIVAAGRSLDSSMAELTELYQVACNTTWTHLSQTNEPFNISEDVNTFNDRHEDGDIRALLVATILYRRVFPSTLLHLSHTDGFDCEGTSGVSPSVSICLTPMLSPPPSPKHLVRRKNPSRAALRVVLDSEAFNRGDSLEDARDRVVDILTSDRF